MAVAVAVVRVLASMMLSCGWGREVGLGEVGPGEVGPGDNNNNNACPGNKYAGASITCLYMGCHVSNQPTN